MTEGNVSVRSVTFPITKHPAKRPSDPFCRIKEMGRSFCRIKEMGRSFCRIKEIDRWKEETERDMRKRKRVERYGQRAAVRRSGMMRSIIIALVVGCIGCFVGCGRTPRPGDGQVDEEEIGQEDGEQREDAGSHQTDDQAGSKEGSGMDREAEGPEAVSLAVDDYEGWNRLLEENEISQGFADGLRDFAYQSGSQVLKRETGNAVYSPLSVYYALALAGCGAEGETAKELLQALQVQDQEELAEQCRKLYQQYHYREQRTREEYEEYGAGDHDSCIRIGNSLWISRDLTVKKDYQELAAQAFFAPSYLVDFGQKETGERIGGWIARQTEGVLKPQIQLPSQTLLAIVDTLYFYGGWQMPFSPARTEEDVFYREDGTQVRCPYMDQIDEMGEFHKGEGYTVSYRRTDNDCRMMFLLPDEGQEVQAFLEDPDRLEGALEIGDEDWTSGKVVWKVPKFAFGSSMELEETLQAMGMQRMFGEQAQFGKIADQPLWVSQVLQEAHIGIDEEGVEGAAYTMMAMAGSAFMEPELEADMILDRPFLFGVQDRNGAWLFLGVCRDPSQT